MEYPMIHVCMYVLCSISVFFFFTTIVYVSVCVHTHTYHSMDVGVRGRHAGVGSFPCTALDLGIQLACL